MAARYHWPEQYILGDTPDGLSFPKAMQYRARALRAEGYWTVVPAAAPEEQWAQKQAAWLAFRQRQSSAP